MNVWLESTGCQMRKRERRTRRSRKLKKTRGHDGRPPSELHPCREMSRSLMNGPDNVLKLQLQKLSLLLKLFLKLIEQSKSLKRCEPIHIDFLQPVHNLLGKRRKDGELDGLRLLAVAVVLQVLH